MSAPAAPVGPVGEPLGACKATAAWTKLVRVLNRDVPHQLHRAQAARQALARRRH